MGEGIRINGIPNGKSAVRTSTLLSQIDEFCFALGGNKPIRSILISNNGMAAFKFMRSVKAWAYETFGTEKNLFYWWLWPHLKI